MNDGEPLARLLDALDPWRDTLVVVGGWAHRLHRFVPGVQIPRYEPLLTKDADIAFSTVSAPTGDLAGALKHSGFDEELSGDHEPPVTRYRLGKDLGGFHAEFLAPLFGDGIRRDGTEDATVREAGVTAQKLRYLDLLLIEPISVDLSSASGIPTQKAMSVRVANPVTFIAQKLLIRKRRMPNKQAQDILYLHDTLELFSGEIEALRAMWTERLSPMINPSIVKQIEGLSQSQFARTTDAIRNAALIAPGRGLVPENLRAACQYGLSEIFG
ncbi:MAG: hypothetical protein HC938_17160 [Nitrospira sp.]|nr:hypothetical protein [Nitrospira sp.]